MGRKKVLRTYQKDARDFILSTDQGGCLFMEMRLGKTLTAIRIVSRLLWGNIPGKFLIVGPNSTHKGWVTDLKNEGFDAVIVKGTPAKKEALLNGPGTFFLLNKEGYVKGQRTTDKKTGKTKTKWEPLEGLLTIPWCAVILDESHFIKNPKSAVSKFFVKSFRHIEFKMCLTGTPIEKNEIDFIQQFLFILGNKAKFDFWSFRASYTRQVAFKTFIGKRGKDQLNKLAERLAFCLRRKDAGLDKEKIFQTRTVVLPPAAKKIYNQVKKEFILEYKNERRITKYIIEQFTILRRICGGFVPLPKDEFGTRPEPDFLHNAKLIELDLLLTENFQEEPVVIFANYKAELDIINKFLTERGHSCGQIDGRVKIGESRWKIENDFMSGKFTRLIVQPQAVKEGVDLSVASTSIYYSLPSGYILWKQTQDRILNLLKEGSLLLIILEVEDSIEVDLWKKLENQADIEDVILNYLSQV